MSIQEDPQNYNDLKMAVELLESQFIIAKLSHILGSPMEGIVEKLPPSVSKKINGAVKTALHKSADAALWSLDKKPKTFASTKLHKLYAAGSGALGGAFGFTALLIELPVSTTIMMRSVADIARSEGFDLKALSTKHACIEVFAMSGNPKKEDTTESGYYITRGFTTEAMRHLSKELAEIAANQAGTKIPRLTPKQTGRWLAALIEKVAERFGFVITNKFAVQAVPIIGAALGATINTLFTDFYQDMARGHFTIKRLENTYGCEQIKSEYEKILESR